jgi:hypothetical protein
MILDDEIKTAASVNDRQRKIHRAMKYNDDETFEELYLDLVEESPDLFELVQSLCDFFNRFKISVGGASG